MSETFQELADIPKDFIREGSQFVRRCTKRMLIGSPNLGVHDTLTLQQPTSVNSLRSARPLAWDSLLWYVPLCHGGKPGIAVQGGILTSPIGSHWLLRQVEYVFQNGDISPQMQTSCIHVLTCLF